METNLNSIECRQSFEKASKLGKTLSRGGITLDDKQAAFMKRCVR